MAIFRKEQFYILSSLVLSFPIKVRVLDRQTKDAGLEITVPYTRANSSYYLTSYRSDSHFITADKKPAT